MVEIDITSALTSELIDACKIVLSQYKLGDSDVLKSIEFRYNNNQFILIANDYLTSLSEGRPPRARKVPVEDLIIWMKEKNINPRPGQTYNQAAFQISEAIYKNGIKARNFLNPLLTDLTEIITEELTNSLAEQIATEIANDINKFN